MAMSKTDIKEYEEGRPFIVGALAVLFRLRDGRVINLRPEDYLDEAEAFVFAWEARREAEEALAALPPRVKKPHEKDHPK